MILNNAKNMMLGSKQIERAYRGTEIVWGLPKEYQRVEYLESSGNQWIDTGYKPGFYDAATIEFVNLTYNQNTNVLFGCTNSTISDPAYALIMENTGRISPRIGSTAAFDTNFYVDNTTRYNVRVDVAGLTVNGVFFKDNTTHTYFEIPQPLYIFNRRMQNGQYPNTGNRRIMKLYGFNLNDRRSMHLIPAIDASSKPCMYDTVSKQPFYNQGTGEFGYELMDGTYVAPI